MKLSRRVKRVSVVLGVVAVLLAAALLWLPSLVVRELTLHYLERAGVSAQIDELDVDLFAGTVTFDGAKGQGENGDGFTIAHLRVAIDYLPLLSQRLSLPRLAIADARVDIRRSADNSLRVGGVTVISGPSDDDSSSNWGLALQQLTLAGLRIHYTQPANGEQPAIDRELVFNDSSARDVVTWQKDNAVPLDADVQVGDSRIRLQGRITPFGDNVSGHFELVTEDFALELLSPLAQAQGLQRLTGTVDSQQQIDIDYDPASALTIALDGGADWQASELALANGLTLSGQRFQWQGQLQFALLRAEGKPATLNSDGRLQSTNMTLARPDAFRLGQASADWQGQTGVTLAADATRIETDGRLAGTGLALTMSGNRQIESPALDWQGHIAAVAGARLQIDSDGQLKTRSLDLDLGADTRLSGRGLNWQGTIKTTAADTIDIDSQGALQAERLDTRFASDTRFEGRSLRWNGRLDTLAGTTTEVDSDGSLKAARLDLAVPGSVDLDLDTVDWQGTIGVTSDTATAIRSDGQLASAALRFAVVDTATFESGATRWNGAMDFDIARQFARRTRGRVIANDARLALPDQPLALSADRFVFNGDYSEQPAGNTLRLRMAGDIASNTFALTNTAIDAPWLALRDAELDNLDIESLDSIAFDTLTARGVRVMGDTDTSAAVLDADTASARGFELAGLRHYRLADLDVDGADIHVRRDDQGMGVMALYFEDDANDAGGGDTAASDSAPSTYTIDHLSLKAPAIGFTDVAVAPTVALSGSNLELSVNDLDTASPERDASYRLALDVGEYGHLDSRGTIAPLADGGMNMDLNAWIRSLALAPLSGYLNAAMGRRIARGVADGTLDLQATSGQLDGNLDTTLSNFRLVDEPNNETDIVFGISMDTALGLVRRRDDTIQFETSILGDVTNPYFSVRNLVREAVLAGLRTTIMSDYSPLGLLNKAKNALLDLGRSLVSKPVVFVAGKHYIRPEDRSYLINIAQSMREKPGLRLTIQGHATPQDADALSLLGGATIDSGNEGTLRQLARQRAAAVRDYLAARDVNPDHLTLAEPVIDREADARPEATFSLTGK